MRASAPGIRLGFKLGEVDARRRLPAWFAMLGNDVGENAAAHEELGSETHESRLRRGNQIVKDAVGHGLMESAFLAERPDVKLEAFQLDALLIRNVIQDQRGEIRLAGFGAQAGELGDFHVDVKIALRLRVIEGFQGFAGSRGHNNTF